MTSTTDQGHHDDGIGHGTSHEHHERAKRHAGPLADFVRHLDPGEPKSHAGMTVIPLRYAAERDPDYRTLGEAIDGGKVRVTELDAGGSVPELRLRNDGSLPTLILGGEELVGAKQNRVLNTTILVPANSDLVVPVSCTEAGRWHSVSPAFNHSGVVAERRVRSTLNSAVTASLACGMKHRGNQGEVWREVDELHARHRTNSPTSAMRDTYVARGNQLGEYLEAFPVVEGQHGLLVLSGRDVIGFDVVSRSAAYAQLHAQLLQSYALEALAEEERKVYERHATAGAGGKSGASAKPRKTAKPSADEALTHANAFLGRIAELEGHSFDSPGMGADVRFSAPRNGGPALVGSTLAVGATTVYGAFFALDDEGPGGAGDPYRATRMTRVSQRRRFTVE